MKRILVLLLLVLTGGSQLQAQLLKKIKDKAAKALETKKPETGSNNDASGANAGGTSGNGNAADNNTKTPAAPPSNGKVVFTLANDENILYDESKIFASNSNVRLFICNSE